jgi:hypothetical protein
MIYTKLTDTKTKKSYIIDTLPKYVINKLRLLTGNLIFLIPEGKGINILNQITSKKDECDYLRVPFISYFETEEVEESAIGETPTEEVEESATSNLLEFTIEPEEIRLRMTNNLKSKNKTNGKVSK